MKKIAWTMLAALTISACATLPTVQHQSRMFTLSSGIDMDAAWKSLVTYVTERGWVVSVLDGDSKFLTTDWHSVTPADVDCGTPGIAIDTNYRARASVTMSETTDGAVRMTINLNAEVTRSFGSDAWQIPCSSRGTVEDRVRAGVENVALRGS